MVIFNRENNIRIKYLSLMMTDEEIKELNSEFNNLLKDPESYGIRLKGEDVNGNYTKELVIRIYTDNNINQFDERVKKLILESK